MLLDKCLEEGIVDLLASVIDGRIYRSLRLFVYQAGSDADGARDEGGEAGAIAILLFWGGKGGRERGREGGLRGQKVKWRRRDIRASFGWAQRAC